MITFTVEANNNTGHTLCSNDVAQIPGNYL